MPARRLPLALFSWVAVALLFALSSGLSRASAGQPELMPPEQPKAAKFELLDGDRVVLLGNTLIERDQKYGYTEAGLTERFPDRNITFRNLGWSGDTVWSDARGQFDPPAEGFKRMKEHVLSLKPSVLLIGYGTNESFAGPDGIPKFLDGLKALIDSLSSTKARIVILSPLRMENLGPPLPDPTRQNKNLELYTAALRKFAVDNHYPFVNLFDTLIPAPDGDAKPNPKRERLTDDEEHLTNRGYFRFAEELEVGLLGVPRKWEVTVDAAGGKVASAGCKTADTSIRPDGLRFKLTDEVLPLPLPPTEADVGYRYGANRMLRISGLKPGKYQLRIDGKANLAATAEELEAGVVIRSGPSFAQAEELRTAIDHKNELYFDRWRPQNVTYLFLFRKHEQGQNAAEIPKFDPLVADQEQQIAKLREPQTQLVELVHLEAGK